MLGIFITYKKSPLLLVGKENMDLDDMSLVYNINLCRICQIPDILDLIGTSTVTDEGETYLDLLKFIFNDIPWIEDNQISLACRSCIKKIIDTSQFKSICLESNTRRGQLSLDPIKLEIEIIENEVITDYDRDASQIEIQPLRIEPFIKVEEHFPKKKKLNDSTESPKSKRKSHIVTRKSKEQTKKEITNDGPEEINNPDRTKCKAVGSYNVCDICQTECKNRYEFDRHMNKHNGSRNYVCNVCGHTYITSSDLKHHSYRHNTEAKYACQICPNKKFKTGCDLRKHRKIMHLDREDYKYLCTECGMKFPQLCALKSHIIRRHSTIRDFKCDICGKEFAEKSGLKHHQTAHTNVRHHKCTLCPKEFKRKTQLNRHKTTQHGIGNYKIRVYKKYDCTYCEKKLTKEKLAVHIRSHTGSKPFSCRLCGMKFGSSSYIKGHVQKNHDIDVHSNDYDTKLYYEVAEEPPLADVAAIIKNSTKKSI